MEHVAVDDLTPEEVAPFKHDCTVRHPPALVAFTL